MMSGPGFIFFWIACICLFGVAIAIGFKRIMRYENEQQSGREQGHSPNSNHEDTERKQ